MISDVRQRQVMDPSSTPHGKIAFEFASALVSGDFEKAHELLAGSEKLEWSSSDLRNEFEQMIDYGGGPPNHIEVMNVMDDWPKKIPGDVGWAYAAIAGDGYSEGIAVVVCSENGNHRIRQIEWGRP